MKSPKKKKSREKNAEIDFPDREILKLRILGERVSGLHGECNVIGSGDWMSFTCLIMGPNQIHIFM